MSSAHSKILIWNLVCLSVKGVRGMLKIFGTKIQFHSRTFEFLCLWWHSYVQSKTWSCKKICLTFDSVCESAWSWNSSQKWMSCLILLVSDFDVQFNFLIFIERDSFFCHATKALHGHTWFLNVKNLEFWFQLDGAVWHASFNCVKNIAFLKSWILGAGLTMSRTLQTWKNSATFKESPSGCQNGLWKMCQIFGGLWRGSPRLCGRSAICGGGCRHQMCMVWIMGIRDRCFEMGEGLCGNVLTIMLL